jgi:hypothetical protein
VKILNGIVLKKEKFQSKVKYAGGRDECFFKGNIKGFIFHILFD